MYDREEQRSAWISADGGEVLRWETADQLVEEAAQLFGHDGKSGEEVELKWSNQKAEDAGVFLSWEAVLGMFERVD